MVGREGIEPSTNGLRGSGRGYRRIVNQVLAALANLEINVVRSQFGHSQSMLVTRSVAAEVRDSRQVTPLSYALT